MQIVECPDEGARDRTPVFTDWNLGERIHQELVGWLARDLLRPRSIYCATTAVRPCQPLKANVNDLLSGIGAHACGLWCDPVQCHPDQASAALMISPCTSVRRK